MIDEISWLEWAFKGLCVAISGLGVYVWSNLVAALRKLRIDVDDLGKDIAGFDGRIRDHQLEDSRIYVTQTQFRDAVMETKDTNKRTHERIDDMASDIGDIKTLIVQTLNGKHK